MKDKALKALKAMTWVRWPLAIAGGLFGLFMLAFAAFVTSYPLEKHKPEVEAKLKEVLSASEVSIPKMAWHYGLSDFSVGVRLSNVAIKDAASIGSAQLPLVVLSFQPLKLFYGKIPVKAILLGSKANLKFPSPKSQDHTSEHGTEEETPVSQEAPSVQHVPKWASYLRFTLEASFDEISADPESLAQSKEASLILSKPRFRALMAGFPGHFEMKFNSELKVDLHQPELSARGPIESNLSGYFQTESGRAVGVKVEEFVVNLSRATLTGMGSLEKPEGIPLSFQSELQLILDSAWKVRSVEFPAAKVIYDKVKVDLSGKAENPDRMNLRWAVGKTEVDGLRLPISELRSVPLRGVLETSGQLNFVPGGLGTGSWRVAFNNITFNASEIPNEQMVTQGSFKVSFMSEGSIDAGRFSSPRTELQIDGTEAELNLWKGRFSKPIGKPLEMLAKFSIRDDKLKMSELKGVFYTAQIDGNGQLDDIVAYMAGQPVDFNLTLNTSRVDIAKYSVFLPLFRRPPPLEGFFEFSGAIDGQTKISGIDFDSLNWRVDRFNLSNFKVIVDRESIVQFGMMSDDFSLNGPFSASLLFKGRGMGTVVNRGILTGQLDATGASLRFKNFVKPLKTPLFLDVSLEQSRQALKINRGQARFHDIEVGFEGSLTQGASKSFIDLKMARPIRLSRLRSMFSPSEDTPLDGKISWTGRLGFKSPGIMEASFDWKTLTVEGELLAEDVSGHFGNLNGALSGGKFRLVFSPDEVTVPQFSGMLGKAKVFASGELRLLPKASKSTAGNIARLLSREDWDLSAAVTMSRLNFEDIGTRDAAAVTRKAPENMKAIPIPTEQVVKEWLDSPLLKKNRFAVSLRTADGDWKGLRFKTLNTKVSWQNNVLKVQPLGMDIFGGSLQGSLLWNAEGYYSRKDAPQLSGSFKGRDLDLTRMVAYFKPEMAGLVAGRFNGDVTVAAQGMGPDDIQKNLRGRMTGEVKQGSFETLQVIKGSVDSLISSSVARDYLMKEARREACFQQRFSGAMDIQLEKGNVVIEKADVAFEAGSKLSFRGRMDSSLKVEMKGEFEAGPKCIGGDARSCLAGQSGGRALLPFLIEGTASEPKVKADYDSVGRKIASCMASSVAHKAEKWIQSPAGEKARNELKKVEDKARDALKGLIKSN